MKNLTLLLLSAAFISCDPGSTDYYYMHNQSDSTIYVTFKANRATEDWSYTFPPHTINEIYHEGHIGTYGDAGSNFLYSNMDSFNVYTDGAHQHKIKLDVRDRINWTHRSQGDTKHSRSGTDRYTLILLNECL